MATTRKWSPQEHDDGVEELGVEARRAAEAAEALHLAVASRPAAKDTPPFAHLAVRSCYSLRDGVIRPRELAAAAAAGGMTHVALTDRDGLYGAVRFAQACALEGVTPVLGTDLALVPDQDRPGWELTRGGRVREPASDARIHSRPPTGTGRVGDGRDTGRYATTFAPSAGSRLGPRGDGRDSGRYATTFPPSATIGGGAGNAAGTGRTAAADMAGGGTGRTAAADMAGGDTGRTAAADMAGGDTGRTAAADMAGGNTGRAGGTGRAGSGPRDDPRANRPGRGPGWLEDDAPRVRFLATTQAGYADLCRTVTAAHAAVRSDPHLAADHLGVAANNDGVIALLGVDSPVGRLLARNHVEAAEQELRRWLDVFGRGRVVLGVRDHRVAPGGRRATSTTRTSGYDPTEPGDDARIRRTLDLADRLDVKAAAVNDVRYLTREDVVLADVMACVRQQVPLAQQHLGRTTAEAWFTTAAEQHGRFRERPDLLANAYEIATSCEVDLGLGGLHVPRLSGLSPEAAAGELHRRCWEGVAARFDRLGPKVRERLERELEMVDRLGLHDLFLAVAAIVQDVRDLGVIVACRGSAAGSLVCYALRISDVDPVANDLAFERFMNPYRDELPDIDLDVESHRREDVYDLVMARYGEQHTACVAMIETFQARMAVREVGKVLGMPQDELGLIAKSFVHTRARNARKAVAALPELKRSNLDVGQLDLLFDVVERIDGFPRHIAMHPCGILLGDQDLTTRTPMERSAHGFSMSQFDKDDVAALGLLKLDVLGVRMLSAMSHALDLANGTSDDNPPSVGRSNSADLAPPSARGELRAATTEVRSCLPATRQPDPALPGRNGQGLLDLDAIPHGDPATYELIRSANSVGIFQIESPGQRELLGRLQPDRFGDLITEISLFRPGPVKADMVSPYVARRHGEETPTYAHPTLEPVLAETRGVIVYHEQVMGVFAALTGCDLAYADLLRRQLAERRKLPAIRGWLISRAVDRGVPLAAAEEVWEQLTSFASFGFCKAHAAAFAVPTERSAFLKAHVFPEFAAGLLTHDPGMYPRRMILDECRLFGIAILPPDVNRSRSAYTVEVVDRGLAGHLLELTAALRAAARGDDPLPHLPPGWRWPDDRDHPVPPTGFDSGEAGGGYRYAVRVGLQDVRGITDAEVEALTTHRPFTSLGELYERGGLSQPTAVALVQAGALDQVAGVGRRGGPAGRRALRLTVEELWANRKQRRRGSTSANGSSAGGGGSGGSGISAESRPAPGTRTEQTRLDLHVDHVPQIPEERAGDRVRDELAMTGMDVSRHVVSFYEPLLEVLEVTRSCDLDTLPTQARVRVAGVKVAIQSPPQRSGQRVMFLSLDDRTGTTQTTYFERSLDDCAWTVLHAWLLVAEGRVSRRGRRGATLIGLRAWDLSRLWRAWQEGWLDRALEERGTPAPHERTDVVRPAGLSASEFGRGSR